MKLHLIQVMGWLACGLLGATRLMAAPISDTQWDPVIAPDLDGRTALPSPSWSPDTEPEAAELHWHRSIESALADATANYRSVLVLFSMRGCPHCHRLKQNVLQDEEVERYLRHFTLAEIDTTLDPMAGSLYGVRSVPVLLFLTADGQERGRIAGAVEKPDMLSLLQSLLDERQAITAQTQIDTWLDWLTSDTELTTDQWRSVLAGMRDNRIRHAIRNRLHEDHETLRPLFVELLDDAQLAVRVAAIEWLEEWAGDDFGYDPWRVPDPADPDHLWSRERWDDWLQRPLPDDDVAVFYSPLSDEQIERYLRDLLSEDRARSLRAARTLVRTGQGLLPAIDEFKAAHPDLPAGLQDRLREIRYTVLLPATGQTDPALLANRLVFGHQDVRLQTLRDLAPHAMAVMPVLEDFLTADDALVRETTIETLIAGGGRRVTRRLAQHAEEEADVDVLITLLRGLADFRTRGALNTMLPFLEHEHEDVVIAVLQGIQHMRDRTAEEAVVARLADERWRVRVAALDAAGALRASSAAEHFEALFNDEDAFVRFKAVQTVGLIQPANAVSMLEELFHREDDLKGPVIQALCSLDRNPPASFADAFADQSPSVLLAITEALQQCGRRGARLAGVLARHENEDVALNALRVIGEYGLNEAGNRSILLEALNDGSRGPVLAALESMNRAREFWSPTSGHMGVFGGFPAWQPETVEEADMDEEVLDLFDAFLGDPDPAAPPVEETEPEPPAVTADDVLDLFMDELAIPASDGLDGDGATVGALVGRSDLLAGVRRFLDDEDPALRIPAAMLLVRARQGEGVAHLDEQLVSLTVGQRTELARILNDWREPPVLALLNRLLRDRAAQVRTASVNSMLNGSQDPDWLSSLFDALTESGSLLRPADLMQWRLRSLMGEMVAGRALRERGEALLTHEDDRLKVLGLVLLDAGWRRGDERAVEPLVTDSNPFVRRAAARALGRNHARGLMPHVEALREDGSEHVRMVLPHLALPQSLWVHRFDVAEQGRDHFQTRANFWFQLTPEQRTDMLSVLRGLSTDPAPPVRLEALLALLARGEQIDATALIDTVHQFSDRSEVGRRIGSFIEENYRQLDAAYLPLLPYLEHTHLSSSRRESIMTHFERLSTDTAQVDQQYRPRPATQQELVEEPEAEVEIEAVPVRLVFFEEPSCPDCELVEMYLAELKTIFPDLTVETHTLSLIRSLDLNEAYADHFEAPIAFRGITPALVSGAGFLAGDDITYNELQDLIVASMGMDEADWYIDPDSLRALPASEELEEPVADPPGEVRNHLLAIAITILVLGGIVALLRLRRSSSRLKNS